jgi:hypothetical protein
MNKAYRINIGITEDYHMLAKMLGDGNTSLGIRRALQAVNDQINRQRPSRYQEAKDNGNT